MADEPKLDPRAPLSPRMRFALDALAGCTLSELGAIELYHFRGVKQAVAKRTVAECAARAAGRERVERISLPVRPGAGWTSELEEEARLQGADGPHHVIDGALAPDEDGDEALEPTETEAIDARPEQWPESHAGPVS